MTNGPLHNYENGVRVATVVDPRFGTGTDEAVGAGAKSEPMLIRGYETRSLFVSSSAATEVEVLVYHQHREFKAATLTMTAGEYVRLDLPPADWCSIKPADATTLTAGVVVG